MEERSTIILTCIVAYMAMCIGIGLWAMRRTHSTQDFFMAGRHLGFIVTAVAVFSSTMSGFGFVGGPGLVYQMGISSIWMVICTSIGYCVSFFLLGKRLRLFAELRDSISLPDAVAARYGSSTTLLLTAIAILFGVIGYLAVQILAMATVLQGILQEVGWEGDVEDLFAAIAAGAAEEADFPAGTPFQWMMLRYKGTAQIALDKCWSGKEPFPGWKLTVNSNGHRWNFTIPKACGNLALSSSEKLPEPKPAAPPPRHP